MRRPSFTLTELLVVVAISGFLIAILLPSLRSSRLQVDAVLCSSNIKQLIFGLCMYETQNMTFPYGFYENPDEPEPPPGGYTGNIAYDRIGWWWFNYISDYAGKYKDKKAEFWCPSRKIKAPELEFVLHGNYGVNRSICKSFDDIQSFRDEFVGTPLSTSKIPRPVETLLIVDSGYSLISWWHAADEPPVSLGNTIIEDTAYIPGLEINKERDLWPSQKEDAIYGRHPNKTVNIGFVDGHVSRPKADALLIEKTANNYKNKSPLWVSK